MLGDGCRSGEQWCGAVVGRPGRVVRRHARHPGGVDRAVRAGDWAKVYGIADTSMRNGMTQAAFVAAMTKAEGSKGITGASARGTTTYTTNEAGARYARTPIRLTYGTGTSATTQDGTLVLVLDAGAWKVFTVE
jgi:hypothetical protein